MLLLVRNGKILEDHEKYEEVVYAEGKLKDVTGQELQAALRTLPEIQSARE